MTINTFLAKFCTFINAIFSDIKREALVYVIDGGALMKNVMKGLNKLTRHNISCMSLMKSKTVSAQCTVRNNIVAWKILF